MILTVILNCGEKQFAVTGVDSKTSRTTPLDTMISNHGEKQFAVTEVDSKTSRTTPLDTMISNHGEKQFAVMGVDSKISRIASYNAMIIITTTKSAVKVVCHQTNCKQTFHKQHFSVS